MTAEMTLEQALAAIRSWRLKPAAIDIVLVEFDRMQRELQEQRRKA